MTLVELLRQSAARAPAMPVVIRQGESTTYAACLARGESLARGIAERGIDRFACAVADPADLIALLAGSSAVGSEACVYPAGAEQSELDRLTTAFGHQSVVSDDELGLTSAETVRLDDLATAEGDLPPPPELSPVLILTTGTTGHRRAARHDWSRLVAAARHGDESPGTRWLLAYNLSQFAGIQMLLHVLASAATLVVPGSSHPGDAIKAMRELGVTHVSATPTFWRLVSSSLDEETAAKLNLRQITLGGEAVPEPLLARLRALFPGARISQVYGATEFGLALSVRDGRSGLPLTLLERDESADVQVRIVDGELHVRSRVGMLGYHGDSEHEGGWRPTGDLVEQRGDRIHFIGRASEVINVGGMKVHPGPVEELVSAVKGVELARAYGRPNPVTGHILVVDVVPADDADAEALKRQIQTQCASLPRAAQPRRVRLVDRLEIRGQKLVREPGG